MRTAPAGRWSKLRCLALLSAAGVIPLCCGRTSPWGWTPPPVVVHDGDPCFAAGARLCGGGCPELPAPACPGFGCTHTLSAEGGHETGAGICWSELTDQGARLCPAGCADGEVCARRDDDELICVAEEVCFDLLGLGGGLGCRYADLTVYEGEALGPPPDDCPAGRRGALLRWMWLPRALRRSLAEHALGLVRARLRATPPRRLWPARDRGHLSLKLPVRGVRCRARARVHAVRGRAHDLREGKRSVRGPPALSRPRRPDRTRAVLRLRGEADRPRLSRERTPGADSSRSDRKRGPSTATRRLQPRGGATSRADVPSRSGNEADGAASAAGRREHFRSDLQRGSRVGGRERSLPRDRSHPKVLIFEALARLESTLSRCAAAARPRADRAHGSSRGRCAPPRAPGALP
jgi:hypothetical protein